MNIFDGLAAVNKLAAENGPGLSTMLAELPKQLEKWGEFQARLINTQEEILARVRHTEMLAMKIVAAVVEEIPAAVLDTAQEWATEDPRNQLTGAP